VRHHLNGDFEQPAAPVTDIASIEAGREMVKQIYLDERIEQYIADLVFATRRPGDYHLEALTPMIAYGGSPRASINLALAARAQAFIRRRGYVVPEDVRDVVVDVLRHRIGLTYEAEAEGLTGDQIVSEILAKVEVP
jgi:MoxR-like ATPase